MFQRHVRNQNLYQDESPASLSYFIPLPRSPLFDRITAPAELQVTVALFGSRVDSHALKMAKRAAILVLLVVAIALVARGAHALSCNRTTACPTQGDANSCVQYIRQLGDSQCCQFNCGGDFCTQMQAIGGARVLICGPCNRCTKCSVVGNALNNVLSQCVSRGRCPGSETADGFTFVIDRRNDALGANATDEGIEMVRDV